MSDRTRTPSPRRGGGEGKAGEKTAEGAQSETPQNTPEARDLLSEHLQRIGVSTPGRDQFRMLNPGDAKKLAEDFNNVCVSAESKSKPEEAEKLKDATSRLTKEFIDREVKEKFGNFSYHVFISKHEEKGKFFALNVRTAMEEVGIKCFISDEADKRDADALQKAICDSAVVFLILTPGIFHPQRTFIWETELMHALDIGKAVICIKGPGWNPQKVTNKDGIPVSASGNSPLWNESEIAVDKFKPYARALLDKCEWHSFHPGGHKKLASINELVEALINADEISKDLQQKLEEYTVMDFAEKCQESSEQNTPSGNPRGRK